MDAIESARHFDCDAVKAYLKGGGNPHIFDKEGGNLMHALLYGYYSEYAFYTEEDKLEKRYVRTSEHDNWFLVYRPWLQDGFGIAIKAFSEISTPEPPKEEENVNEK